MTLSELKKHVGDKKLILGKDRVMKALRNGSLKEVFLAVNCSLADKADIDSVAVKEKVKVSVLEINNDEMGVVVKKPFSVSIAGLQK